MGCRLNQIESESAARLFIDENFSVSMSSFSSKTPIDDSTFLCVVNTCAVTGKAEQKDRRVIRLMLEKLPNATIVVTGCYAQLSCDNINSMDKRVACLKGQIKSRISDVAIELKKAIEEEKFDSLLFSDFLRNKIFSIPQKKIGFSENAFYLSTDTFLNHSRSSIKIQDGCNSSCSYCAIHLARGHSVSLDAEIIIDRIRKLEEAGQNEVVFTAVNLAQYKGLYKDSYIDFPHLLKLCLENTKKISFRISSIYPEIVTDFFCEIIKDKRVRPHFHISVQSGSNRILKLMGRNYEKEKIVEVSKRLRASKENPFLACDIIVGFPSETENDFQETVSLCKECDFAWIHVFPFSARPKTVAAKMKNQVSQEIKKSRVGEISRLSVKGKISYIKSCKNKIFSCVIENAKKIVYYTEDSKNPSIEIFHSVTENFLHCEIKAKKGMFNLKQGMASQVKILDYCEAEIIKNGEIDCLAELLS